MGIRYEGNLVMSVTTLEAKCDVCGARASFRVVRNNDYPPEGFLRGGSITTNFCTKHLPEDARNLWRSQL